MILIMDDDIGFSDVGCYGAEINTPDLDALVNKIPEKVRIGIPL